MGAQQSHHMQRICDGQHARQEVTGTGMVYPQGSCLDMLKKTRSPYLTCVQGLLWQIDLEPTPNWRENAPSDEYSLRISAAHEPDGSRIMMYCTGEGESAVSIVRAAVLQT